MVRILSRASSVFPTVETFSPHLGCLVVVPVGIWRRGSRDSRKFPSFSDPNGDRSRAPEQQSFSRNDVNVTKFETPQKPPRRISINILTAKSVLHEKENFETAENETESKNKNSSVICTPRSGEEKELTSTLEPLKKSEIDASCSKGMTMPSKEKEAPAFLLLDQGDESCDYENKQETDFDFHFGVTNDEQKIDVAPVVENAAEKKKKTPASELLTLIKTAALDDREIQLLMDTLIQKKKDADEDCTDPDVNCEVINVENEDPTDDDNAYDVEDLEDDDAADDDTEDEYPDVEDYDDSEDKDTDDDDHENDVQDDREKDEVEEKIPCKKIKLSSTMLKIPDPEKLPCFEERNMMTQAMDRNQLTRPPEV